MEDILVKIPSAYESLFENEKTLLICEHYEQFRLVNLSTMLSIIDDQNNTIEALREEIQHI